MKTQSDINVMTSELTNTTSHFLCGAWGGELNHICLESSICYAHYVFLDTYIICCVDHVEENHA